MNLNELPVISKSELCPTRKRVVLKNSATNFSAECLQAHMFVGLLCSNVITLCHII